MQGYYITGTNGSYIELEDGRWADSVCSQWPAEYKFSEQLSPTHDGQFDEYTVAELLPLLTDANDYPEFCLLSMDELREYVGAQ